MVPPLHKPLIAGVGCDTTKNKVNAMRRSANGKLTQRTCANTCAVYRNLIDWLGKGPFRVVVEASGINWTLLPEIHARLVPRKDFRQELNITVGADSSSPVDSKETSRIPSGEWDNLKAKVIRQCAEPLANTDVCRITGLDCTRFSA